MTTYKERVWANKGLKTYGSAVRIKKNVARAGLVGACVATPCTNWAIPLVPKIVKRDIIIRYEKKRRR